MISVSVADYERPCSICVARAVREPDHVKARTMIVVSIESGVDDSWIDTAGALLPDVVALELCQDHALKLINALGFVYCSATGTTISKLLGTRERKSKRKAGAP